jgi:hypothetical protein
LNSVAEKQQSTPDFFNLAAIRQHVNARLLG